MNPLALIAPTAPAVCPHPLDADRLTLPLELLEYAHEMIFRGVDRGYADLQETMSCYRTIIILAMDEITRLHEAAMEYNPS
jgi:hypothetical protein